MSFLSGKQAFLQILKDEGVDTMFGNPGTTELPLMDGLVREPGIRYVLALQEAVAISMTIPTMVATIPDDLVEALAITDCNTSAACCPISVLNWPLIALCAASRPKTNPAIAMTIRSTGAREVIA